MKEYDLSFELSSTRRRGKWNNSTTGSFFTGRSPKAKKKVTDKFFVFWCYFVNFLNVSNISIILKALSSYLYMIKILNRWQYQFIIYISSLTCISIVKNVGHFFLMETQNGPLCLTRHSILKYLARLFLRSSYPLFSSSFVKPE